MCIFVQVCACAALLRDFVITADPIHCSRLLCKIRMCVCACVQKIEQPQTNPLTDTHTQRLSPYAKQTAILPDTHVYVCV